MNIAIICAAGSGQRLKRKTPKALISINRKPLFVHALKPFLNPKSKIEKILILAPKNHLKKFTEALNKNLSSKNREKILAVIAGGRERQQSIEKGLNFLEKLQTPPRTIILVHNAANIFATFKDIQGIIQTAKKGLGAAVALPSCDTLREVNSRLKPQKKLDRQKIWRMQTPQGAFLQVLLEAYRKAKKNHYQATDDLELIEKLGHPIKIIPGSQLNFKITYPQDLQIAKALLK